MFIFSFNNIMKKLVIKVVCIILITFFLTIIINNRYIEVIQCNDETEKFHYVPEAIQVSNIGSSHGGSFNYKDIDSTCFNFALSSQTLSYDYQIILYYQEYFEDSGIMFIPVSYHSFFGMQEIYQEDFDSKNKRYYKFLSGDYIKEYDRKVDFYVNYMPALTAYEELAINLSSSSTEDIDPTQIDGYIYGIDVQKDAQEAVDRHIKKNRAEDSGKIIVNEEEIEALYHIIGFCKGKNITPILVTTPYLKEYNDLIKEQESAAQKIFYSIIKEVQDSQNVDYFDFSADERFTNNYDLFLNSDHLNEKGAILFTDIIMKEILQN